MHHPILIAFSLLAVASGPWVTGAARPRVIAPAVAPAASSNPLVGITVPSRIAAVAPEQPGKIVQVTARDGDRVSAGDPLFLLNATLEQLEVDRLRALADSDLHERRAVLALEHAEQQASRIRDLRSRDISSERDLQAAILEVELARLKVEQAKLDRTQAINSHAQAAERLAQRTVRSPFPGIVTARFKGEGEAVERFVPVIEVVSLDPLHVEFDCPLSEQHRFTKGSLLSVAPATRPDDVRTATVLFVSPKATAASHTLLVRAAIANPRLDWQSGLKVFVAQATDVAAPPPSRPGK
jgi:RND family efflux transporter MFP subunit